MEKKKCSYHITVTLHLLAKLGIITQRGKKHPSSREHDS